MKQFEVHVKLTVSGSIFVGAKDADEAYEKIKSIPSSMLLPHMDTTEHRDFEVIHN